MGLEPWVATSFDNLIGYELLAIEPLDIAVERMKLAKGCSTKVWKFPIVTFYLDCLVVELNRKLDINCEGGGEQEKY